MRTASTRSNEKTVSQAEHFHTIGLLVWSLKTVAVRTGMETVSHRAIQDASPVDFKLHHYQEIDGLDLRAMQQIEVGMHGCNQHPPKIVLNF